MTSPSPELIPPKARRDRLFWKSAPEIRPAVKDDAKWLRTALKIEGTELTDEEFANYLRLFDQYQEHLIIEDDNARYATKRGPVGMLGGITNGYLYEPHVNWFPWATGKNKLRGLVMFLQKWRYRKLGVVRVHTQDQRFFANMRKYVPLYKVGKIPCGDELGRGDDYIFYMKCRGAKHG